MCHIPGDTVVDRVAKFLLTIRIFRPIFQVIFENDLGNNSVYLRLILSEGRSDVFESRDFLPSE
jgi:hypothetical protein